MVNNHLSWPGRLLATLLLASALQPALAQQDDAGQQPATETGTLQDSDKAQESNAKTDDQSEPTPTSRQAADTVFKPSEEISEDLSVPFPVDI